MNFFRTSLLLAAMTALFMAVGYVFGGQTGMMIAFLVAAGMNLLSYWNSDRMVLAMYRAREVDEQGAPEFYRMIALLSQRAGLPMPRVYIIDEDQPNAFATGRNPQNAAVAATTGLLRRLSTEEIAGVMAHELAHVRNRDTLTMTITATFAGAISMLANFGWIMGGSRENRNPLAMIATAIIAPFAAMLVQMAISRSREYAADRLGAEICGQPLALASALGKIAGEAAHRVNRAAEANPATAHLFIINPLAGHGADSLFATHPSTANRIAALQEIAVELGMGVANSAQFRQTNARQTNHQHDVTGSLSPDGDGAGGPWGSPGRRQGQQQGQQQDRQQGHWPGGPWG